MATIIERTRDILMAGSIYQVELSSFDERHLGPVECGGTIHLHDENSEWFATLTRDASSVRLFGPTRIFAEPTATHAVTHAVWVRTMPKPFDGTIDLLWLRHALAANGAGIPDILGIAMQYVHGAPAHHDGNMQIAGHATYGPLKDGKRQEGSDFNDYLGLTWNYAENSTDFPERNQFRCLDCSGFMRMVWGFRHSMKSHPYVDNLPLCLEPGPAAAIPRRAHEMFGFSPGIPIIENVGARPDDLSALAPGDLVFFDADEDDGPRLDHVGMYLGIDNGGSHRFISSRKTHNGPTLGDVAGASTLSSTGHYGRAFRCARRL